MSTGIPTTLTQLLEFIGNRTEALSDAPSLDEMADFANGCSDTFVATHGELTEVVPSPHLMRTLLNLNAITGMDEVVATVVNMEQQHRILFACEFSRALLGHNTNDIAMRIEPLEKLIKSPYKYGAHLSEDAEYIVRIPDEHR